MATPSSDRKPLLSNSQQNFHSSHGLAPPPIRFPTSNASPSKSQGGGGGGNNELWRSAHGDASGYRFGRNDYAEEDERLIAIRGRNREGLPKLTRECLWSEIKCYGSYILPVLLVFGVGVIGLSLWLIGLKKKKDNT